MDAAGAVVRAGGLTLLGVAAGNSFSKIEDGAGHGSFAVAIATATVVGVVMIRRRVTAGREPLETPTPRTST